MIGDIKDVLANLNSPSDWAIVGAAGLIGFVADAAINIVPLPIFSPGVCGAIAAGAALTAKRGWDARMLAKRRSDLVATYYHEIARIIGELRDAGHDREADALDFDLKVALTESDLAAFRDLLVRARGFR